MKIPSLAFFVKDAKKRYDDNLDGYIKNSISQCIPKVFVNKILIFKDFFAGIEDLLKSNNPEEVSFQSSFNKKSARKILALTSKDLKKSLNTLLKSVQKQFPDASLLHVVWHSIQKEMLTNWTRYEELSNLIYCEDFLFPVAELIEIFAEISKSKIK